MIIGIPRERKTLEKRIALTPEGAKELTLRGHTVLIEKDAGAGSFFDDKQYVDAGAQIVPTLKEVWERADLVVKVKEPHESEFDYFRPGLALFDYLHLASLPTVAAALVKGKVTGIAYELVKTSTGRLPLLEPMSEVAGKLSILNGANFLLSQNGGRGILLGGTTETEPAEVVIIGAGISGLAACDVAAGAGARVTILDNNYEKLEKIRLRYGNQVRAIMSTAASLPREVSRADLLVGAVLVPGAAAPKIITRDMIKRMKRGAVFVDISIDQGGCAETSRPTNLDAPVYVEDGVIHYGVCNMPAQTPRTSTMALTNTTLPYIIKLADMGIERALKESVELRGALNTHDGKLTNEPVSEAVKIPYTPIEQALR